MVPEETSIPCITGEVAPEPDKVLIVFPLMFALTADETIPATVELAPEDESVLMILFVVLVIFPVTVPPPLIPITLPPVPVELNEVMVLAL